jgi:hypothetical protein
VVLAVAAVSVTMAGEKSPLVAQKMERFDVGPSESLDLEQTFQSGAGYPVS